MNKIIVTAVVIAGLFGAHNVNAQEVYTKDGVVYDASVSAEEAAVIAESNTVPVAERFASVCESGAVKSEELTEACASGAMPKMVKDGSRFSKRGIGDEVNTILRNIASF